MGTGLWLLIGILVIGTTLLISFGWKLMDYEFSHSDYHGTHYAWLLLFLYKEQKF